ncbi:MAG: hypothetical protein ACLQG3_14645 [Terracidiphilus sp.]
MANIYVEGKGPKGVQLKESLLPAAVAGYTRGLAVVYGADANHCALASALAQACVGILEEDAINVNNPCAVIEFGNAVAEIGANVAAAQLLTVNAAGQLIPAAVGQAVLAVALEAQVYVAPGSFATVLVLGLFGFTYPGSANTGFPVTHVLASGAIPVVAGTYGLGSGAALALTLAAPTNAQDGTALFIVAETAHAHKVVTPANTINGADDTVTFAAIGDAVKLVAVGGKWMVEAIGGPTPAALTEV